MARSNLHHSSEVALEPSERLTPRQSAYSNLSRNINVALEPLKKGTTMSEVLAEKPQVLDAKSNLPAIWLKDDIKKDQDSIRKALTELDASIHMNAVQCMMHAEEHGDTSLFRRLVVDIVNKQTGYRLQSLIAWMRAYSPMVLVGDVIKLTGVTEDGEKIPWRVKEAFKTPFWTAKQFDEAPPLRPVFRDALMAKVNTAIRDFKNARDNTVNGKPVDPLKPFFDGLHETEVASAFANIEAEVIHLQTFRDSTMEARKAEKALKRAHAELAEAREATA